MQNSNIHKTKVVIAGAGPTGLSLAAQLIRFGIDFILIEKNETTTLLSKAIVVQARSLEIFQELGIAEKAISHGRVTNELNLFYKGKRKAAIDLSGLGKGLSDFTFALSLEQSKTEELLAEYLLQNGKQIEWKSELTRFEELHDGMIVYFKDHNGVEQKIESEYLVGCDGAASLVRHQLNFSFKGSTEPKLFYVADVQLESPVINKNILYMFMIPKGFVLFFPMAGTGHYRIIGILPEYDKNIKEYKFSDIENDISKQIIIPVTFQELRWFSTYRVHSRRADSFMQGRCFIAGDAAHIHTPAGGQGMNTGIQDAYNLAWKIACRIRREVNEDVLKSYNTERLKNANRLLQSTDRAFDIMAGTNPFWNFLRLSFFSLFLSSLAKSRLLKRKFFPLISQTGIAYRNSFLTSESSVGKMKAGDRIHYFVLSNGRNIFSYLSQPVFKLLCFGTHPIEIPNEKGKIKFSFLCFKEVPESVFGKKEKVFILLRPDNHISYIGEEMEPCLDLLIKFSG